MEERVVFFDGICELCNGFVDFVLRFDREHKLHFSPLQGQYIKTTKASAFCQENSLVFLDRGAVYLRSSAVLHALASLGGFWKTLLLFLLVPRFIRDGIYVFVAKNRYRWFGKRKECRLPTAQEKQFFLE